MGPKRNKKKSKNQDDQEFPNQDKIISKWAQALQNNSDNQQTPDAQQLYSKPTKAVFQYDFSNQKALDQKLNQPVKPPKDKYADYTPQQLQQVKKLEQKDKLIKQAKNKQKNEKRKQRKKQIEIQKAIQKVQKQKQEQQQKKVQQQIKKQKSKQANPWCIPCSLFLFLIFMFVLQYNQQIHQRLAKFKLDQTQDYYEILQADQGTTDKQLKNKYKKLVMKYHPDRNPDCQNCKQKFDKIMKAWEILGDSDKRKQYDQNSGHISELKSSSTTLTPYNYHYLVEESNYLWMIQVYDSTNTYSRYFGQFWEQMVDNFGDVIKFGRVDIWYQSQMSSYLPYKFQVFPSVYILDQGYSQICTFNFERPIQGLKKCLEQPHSKIQQKLIKQIPEKEQKQQQGKINVYLPNKLRGNIRVKSYNRIYQKYFNFIFVEKETNVRQAIVLRNQNKYVMNFTQNSKKVFGHYQEFLQSFIIQEVSTCRFLNQCSQKKCLLVLNSTKIPKIKQSMPFSWKAPTDPSQSPYPPPIYALTDSHQQLGEQIKKIQQIHGDIHQNFDIGLFEGQTQRIDLGYVDEVDILSSEEGERFQLQCKVYTWKDKMYMGIEWVKQKFFGKIQQ